jgi:hypothetical protein
VPYVPPTRFYIYGITVDGKVCYIGKGSDKGRYSRIMGYFEKSLNSKNSFAREMLQLARDRNAIISYILFEEVAVPPTSTLKETRAIESVISKREAHWIKQHGGPSILWNRTHGGRSGSTASDETRKRMSEAQKRREHKPMTEDAKRNMSKAAMGRLLSEAQRMKIGLAMKLKHEDEEFQRRQREGMQLAKANGTQIGRPRGWTVSVQEAKDLGLPAGKVELTNDQTNKLRNYRYAHARKVL